MPLQNVGITVEDTKGIRHFLAVNFGTKGLHAAYAQRNPIVIWVAKRLCLLVFPRRNKGGTTQDQALCWQRRDSSEPFAALDALYSGIMKTSPNPMLAVKWIRTVLTYAGYEAWYIAAILESSPGETGYLLGPLC